MKIVYIGSNSSFSFIPFLALVKSKHDVCAFAYDDVNSHFSIITSNSIQSVALNHSLDLIKIDADYSNAILKIRSYQPDIIIVSCYPRLLPSSLISIAKEGCFNIHPSMLPLFRGPVPLFWQFREGVDDFGVTLHRMTNKFDDGNIISQKIVKIKDGVSQSKATELLAESSCNLVMRMLDDIEKSKLTEKVQDTKHASYQTYPEKNDYSISLSWSAKRIFNFVSAYKEKGRVFICKSEGNKYKLLDVYSYQNTSYIGDMNNESENTVILSCNPGYIRCEVEYV